jgi:aminobenzoyl-glutamate transport protein
VHPLVNWYFMIVSTFLVTGVATWVTVKIVEPKLGEYDPSRAEEGAADDRTLEPLSALEKRGCSLRRWRRPSSSA